MTIKEFVNNNISFINNGIKFFCKKNDNFNELEIKTYLKNKFFNEIQNKDQLNNLINDFKRYDFKKSKIINLANDYKYYKTDLEHFLKSYILFELSKNIDEISINNLSNFTIKKILELSNMPLNKFKFIERNVKSLLSKSLFLVFKGGFTSNLLNINEGTMTANAGDSTQFLFVSRAILAGFNCSIVDVRSSKYDAIIDFNNNLLRVQIKGFSIPEYISFFDRSRGGQGIDYKHERNVGKRITSKNCDIYVAVDKQVGICYIIPMTYADSLSEEEAKRVSINKIEKYRENWKIIKEINN